jgi:hypothetical protein
MKYNNVHGIRRQYWQNACMYLSPHINLNNIDDNATTRIKLATKKEMRDTNIEHITNLI